MRTQITKHRWSQSFTLTILSLAFCMASCEQYDSYIYLDITRSFQKEFSISVYNSQANLNLEIDWSDFESQKRDSATFYEFNVIDPANMSNNKTAFYRLIILEMEEEVAERAYFLLKINPDNWTDNQSFVYLNTSSMKSSAIINWYDQDNQIVRLEKYKEGELVAIPIDKFDDTKYLAKGRCVTPLGRKAVGCEENTGGGYFIEIIIEHYTDWYTVSYMANDPSNVSVSYSNTTFDGTTSEYVWVSGDQGYDYGNSSTTYKDTNTGGFLHPSLVDNILEAELWEQQIDDSQVDPCIKNILVDLKNIETGIGQFINEMSEDNLFEWNLKSADIPNDGNCEATDYAFSSIEGFDVTSYFDSSSLNNASDLGVASLILHETVHAYLQLLYQNDNIDKTYRKLFNRWVNSNQNYWDEHENIYNDFFLSLANTLQEYGQLQGYSLDFSTYEALAWGGLTSISEDGCSLNPAPWFLDAIPSGTDRQGILDIIEIELTGKDTEGNIQEKNGEDVGC